MKKKYEPLIKGVHCDSCAREMPKTGHAHGEVINHGAKLEFCNDRCFKLYNDICKMKRIVHVKVTATSTTSGTVS